MINQVYLFGIFILNGFLIGILFDIFRILRKSFKTNNFLTYIEDIIFWLLTGFLILYSIFKFNNGEIRMYIFIGIIIGYVLYLLVFSKIFIQVNFLIINIIKKIISYIFIIPIKFLYKLFKVIIFKKILSKFKVNLIKLSKKNIEKKDFT